MFIDLSIVLFGYFLRNSVVKYSLFYPLFNVTYLIINICRWDVYE